MTDRPVVSSPGTDPVGTVRRDPETGELAITGGKLGRPAWFALTGRLLPRAHPEWPVVGCVPGSPAAEALRSPDEEALTEALCSWWHAYPSQQDDPTNTASRFWATTGETLPIGLDGATRAFVRYVCHSPAVPETADEDVHAKVRSILEDVYGTVNPDVDDRAVSALASAGVLRTPTEPAQDTTEWTRTLLGRIEAKHSEIDPTPPRDADADARWRYLSGARDALLTVLSQPGASHRRPRFRGR